MIYVGIIGPKPFLLGGHNSDNPIRRQLRSKIQQVLNELLNKHQCIKGLTGLSIGCEQDFATSCKELGIDYEVVLPFDNQEEMLTDVCSLEYYERLLQDASGMISLGGLYSPKAIIKKYQRIIQSSDYVILVNSPLINYERVFAQILSTKQVISLDVS
jgi:uncharacterized phage-like protein YoqJ